MHSRNTSRSQAFVATGIVAMLMLMGCSAEDQGGSSADTTGAGAETAADAPRSIEHARGTTEVPASPQRVVTLEPLELDTAVALGITPVGAAVASNVADIPAYLGVEGVAPVGTVPEPDLEAIAALEPDLILGTESRHSELYPQLSSIAPTVFIATQADPWRENAALIGEALGRESDVSDLLADVDERCDALASEYAPDGETVNLLRPRDETTLSLYGPVSFAGSLLECVGFTIPDQVWEDGLQADISPENIVTAAADHLFITTADTEDPASIPAAVTQNGSVFGAVTLVDTSTWVAGVGPMGALSVLGDIEDYLSERS